MTRAIVLQKKSKKRPQLTKAIPRAPRKTVDEDLAKYYLALTDPFHPGAVGAKVPDQYSCPTTTQTVRASFTITANATGAAGAVCFPNPVASTCLFNGNCPDFQNITWGDNTVANQARWGVDRAAFANKLDNYRVVGYGIRITGLSSMTNSSGKFILGAYPIKSKWVTKDFPVGGTTMPTNVFFTNINTMASWGVPTIGATQTPSLLVNLPGSKVISAIEASENIFGVTPRLSSPEALAFRDSNDNFMGFDSVVGSTNTGDSTYLELDGHEACYVYYTGGVPNVSTFDLELIYHLEGKPNLSTGSSIAASSIQPSQAQAVGPVKPIGMLRVFEEAAKEPVVKKVVEEAAGFIHPMLGRLAGSIMSIF